MILKKNLVLFHIPILFFLFSCKETPLAIQDSRVNDYALYDASGSFHRLSTYNDSKAIVLLVQGNGCPIVGNVLSDFNIIVQDYKRENFKFFMINSNIQDSRDLIYKESKEFDFQVPVLSDNNQLIADVLDITIVSEVIILHPTKRDILYRGPINNRLDYGAQINNPTETYLRDALEAILLDKTPISKSEKTRGCKVTRRSSLEKDILTYTKDIAVILKDQCIRCHTEGGVAPWAMSDYNTIKGWSAMIEQVLLSQRMPPWKADPEIGVFKNSFELPDEKRRKIIRWIKNGMNYGEGEDILMSLNTNDIKTPLENKVPDTIITLKKELIPATGFLDYRHQKIKLNLPKGKWLSGITIESSNLSVVHHATIASSAKRKLVVNRPERPWIDNLIAVYLSGSSNTTIFPENSGIYLDIGDDLILQTHFTTTGKEEENITKIHLYFHKEKPYKEYFPLAVATYDIDIMPYSKRTKITARDTITNDIYVHSILPHMHYRGVSSFIKAIQPNGEVLDLISVPDYNFNWQFLYEFEQPIFLPKGTIIVAEGIYNNSYQNPLNPDPSKKLEFGFQSVDEMFNSSINYTLADKK